MEARRSRTIEITILSAENLRMNGKPGRKNTYVVVQTQPSTKFSMTKMTTESGSNPSWNEKFLVELPLHEASWITLEVQCKTWLGVRSVGAAQIAASDFLGGFVAESCLQSLSYRLWDRRCQRNGIINFSVRVMAPERESLSSTQTAAKGSMMKNDKNLRWFGKQVTMDENESNEAVTGIPVSWNYPANIAKPM